MKLACGTVSFRNISLEEALKRIKKAGYEYAEPQATAPFCPHVDVDKDDPVEFKRMLERVGLKGATALWATHGALIPDAQCVEYGRKCIEWAAEAGIPGINMGDGFKPKGMSDDDALKLVEDRLGAIMETAGKFKTYVAIEPHGSFSFTGDGLLKLMSLSDSPWLGVNYDTANVHRGKYVESLGENYVWRSTGDIGDEVAVLKAVAKRVVHVHVKDLKGEECVALGKGDVDLKGCLAVLRDAGYKGPLSLETEGDFSADEGERMIVESRAYLTGALKSLKYS